MSKLQERELMHYFSSTQVLVFSKHCSSRESQACTEKAFVKDITSASDYFSIYI
jgi:hypothetical protein